MAFGIILTFLSPTFKDRIVKVNKYEEYFIKETIHFSKKLIVFGDNILSIMISLMIFIYYFKNIFWISEFSFVLQ